jgi:hypothetical protein
MKIRPTAMTLEELRAWEKGQAQKRMLRLVVQMMIDGACDREL